MTLGELRELLRADMSRLISEPDKSGNSFRRLAVIFSPRFLPVLLVRLARYCYLNGWLRVLSPVLTWLNVFLFGIEVTAKCEVGPGLMLPHTCGTVIGASSIGANATIFQGVTLGATFADLGYHPEARPTVGDGVLIGAGAKVLGGISIGDRAVIGANSLVLESMEAGAFAIGVPAMVRRAK